MSWNSLQLRGRVDEPQTLLTELVDKLSWATGVSQVAWGCIPNLGGGMILTWDSDRYPGAMR